MAAAETDHDSWQIEVLEQLSRATHYLDWQLSFFEKWLGGEMLEIGCGTGTVTKRLLERGANVTAVDDSESALAALHGRLSHYESSGHLRLIAGDIESNEFWSRIPGPFDAAIAVNVIEHITEDGVLVGRLAERIAPGGRLLVLVPAGPALYGTADRMAQHRRRYRPEDLRRLFETNGFAVRTLQHFNMIGAIGWWLRFVLRKEENFSTPEIGTMERLTPLMRRLESIAPVPFGLSLVAVGEKRRH